MKKLSSLIFMLLMLPLTTLAQVMACRGFVEEGYDFWLYLPDSYEKAEELPLVMFLHGKSLSGDSLEMVLQYGSIHALFKGRAINAIVVALCIKAPDQIRKNLKMLESVWNDYQVYLNDEIDFASDAPMIGYPLVGKD